MNSNVSGLSDLMCAAVEIKEKMKTLYAEAVGKCSDRVGSETFRMLHDMEEKHLETLREMYADLSKGAETYSCKFYDFETLNRSEIIKRIGQNRGNASKACLDDVAAIESGLDLENKSITYFEEQAKKAAGQLEREFLIRMLAEERAHYIVLADLKFYYTDTAGWLMEKGRADLDGA